MARQAEQIKPDEPTVLDTMGWIYYKQGNSQMAVATLEKAAEKSDDSGVINYHLARVLVDSDRLDEARERLEKALAVEGNYPERAEAEALLEKLKEKS